MVLYNHTSFVINICDRLSKTKIKITHSRIKHCSVFKEPVFGKESLKITSLRIIPLPYCKKKKTVPSSVSSKKNSKNRKKKNN